MKEIKYPHVTPQERINLYKRSQFAVEIDQHGRMHTNVSEFLAFIEKSEGKELTWTRIPSLMNAHRTVLFFFAD